MNVTFRNVDASPADPVSTWPFEAVLTALERGGLTEWRRLAAEIREDPWGQVARDVAQAIDVGSPYGVAELMTEVIARARRAAEQAERAAVASEVTGLIARSGRTRARFAADIGTSASRLSTYANGSVMPSAAMLVRMRRVAARPLI